MNEQRRAFVRTAVGAVAVLVLAPLRAWGARPDDAFVGKTADDVMKSLFGTTSTETGAIDFKAPDIAENGAVVPVTVEFDIPGAESVSIIAEKNPSPLAASFYLEPGSGGLVATRIKLRETTPVHVVVKAGGKLYHTSREIKVTIGGCGG